MEEGILPHSRARESPEETEEERRLCFVGITRCQKRLILSRAAYRMIRGRRERTVPSPFLNELPPGDLDITDRTGLDNGADRMAERQRMTEESRRAGMQFRRGQLVRHATHGLGRIVEVNDMGQHTIATVDFNTAGQKRMVLQYTQLELVG